ncbi:MAG: hypothetical protein ABI067_17795 [Leifsonia sp.]
MIDWNAIIWFVVWAVVILASAGLVIWLIFASFAAARFRAVKKDFDKGFDSDFFKNHR